jgi:hypothetical protein
MLNGDAASEGSHPLDVAIGYRFTMVEEPV